MIAEFFDVSEDHASSEVGRELVDARLDLNAQFTPLQLTLDRSAGGPQMVFVFFEIVRGFILWGALSLAIVINDQIARQPHQPVLQISLLRIVLVKRTVDANENFLRQIFGRISAGREPVRQVVNAAAVGLDNLFPGRAITLAASSD